METEDCGPLDRHASAFSDHDNDDDIYLAKKPGYQKGHKPINAGCPYKKILYVNIINIINIIC